MKQHIPEKQNFRPFYIALLLMIVGLVLVHSFHISPETEKFVQILAVFAIYGLMWLAIQ